MKGQWEGRVVVGHKENGEPLFRYVYARTQKELLGKLHQKIEEYRGAELTEQSGMRLGAWLDKWLTEYAPGTVRESTLRSYRNIADKHIKPVLGDKPVAFITAADVQKLYSRLRKQGRAKSHPEYGHELADSTVGRIHCLFHEAMEAAVKEHLISANPTKGAVVPKGVKKEMRVLGSEQLAAFMEQIDAEEHWRDFFYTELTTGLRRGEICGLKWSDFDEESGRLNIRRTINVRNGAATEGDTKTGKGRRSFYLPVSTANMLRERKRTAQTQWIFPDPLRPELPIAPAAAYRKMKRLLQKAGLPDIRFHDLRHTFATTALQYGMDVKTLSAMIGHISAETTLNIYTHITDDMQKNAADKIERGFGRGEGSLSEGEKLPAPTVKSAQRAAFEPYRGKYRKPGTGCVSMLNDHLFEGRYSPTNAYGKRISKIVYARTKEECEEKLAALIARTKAEIAEEKKRLKAGETPHAQSKSTPLETKK